MQLKTGIQSPTFGTGQNGDLLFGILDTFLLDEIKSKKENAAQAYPMLAYGKLNHSYQNILLLL